MRLGGGGVIRTLMTAGPYTPAAPANATAFGITNLALADDFTSLSTIDLQNTRAGSFLWWTNNGFPQAFANGTAWANITTAIPSPASIFSQSGSLLAINDDVSHIGTALCTIAALPGGLTAIGQTFGGGKAVFVRASLAFDPSLSSSAALSWNSWPIHWLVPKEFLLGQITSTNFNELDCFEGGPFGAGGSCLELFTCHDWNTSSNNNNFNNNNHDQTSVLAAAGVVLTNQNIYDFRIVPAALNGGTGLLDWWVNGQHLIQQTYSQLGAPSPSLSPSNNTGALFNGDSENFALILGAGHNWPIIFDNVAVWQSS